MEQLVAILNEDCKIIFGPGKFDNWCVYVLTGEKKYAPKDIDYLTEIKLLTKKYAADKLYSAILAVYNHTYSQVDNKVIELIEHIVESFFSIDQFAIKKCLVIIYAGMIAENNKAKTKLGKRIKLLAIHQLLKQNFTPNAAANFSKRKTWKELDKIMNDLGV